MGGQNSLVSGQHRFTPVLHAPIKAVYSTRWPSKPQAKDPPVLPGVVGNYRVLERISSGGTGVVYKAIDTRLNRPVAIKTFLESRTLGTETIANLQREARAVASIDHPYICKVYELLELEGQPLIVMEFLEGQ